MHNLSISLIEQHKINEGLSLLFDTMSIANDENLKATIINDIGVIYFSVGDYIMGDGCPALAQHMREELLGANHPDVGESLKLMADSQKKQGDYQAAEQYYRRALAILEKSLGPNHPTTMLLKNNLNDLLEKKKAAK
jgi:tetratricopeptide (TPR) repeat protein